jgi:Ca2+:H+ antiporter
MSAIVRAPSQRRSADEGPLSEKPKTNSSNSHSRSPSSVQRERQAHNLPTHNGQINPTGRSDAQDDGDVGWGRLRVRPAGESGRKGLHPWHFLRIAYRSSSTLSSYVNLLWPVVPAAIAVRYSLPDNHMLIFILSYIAMVPCANLIGFAGQELARKVPHVFGVLVETTLGSVVEIILFLVLLVRPANEFQVIQSAILGSILATMLLCLGMCFFVGGLRRDEQEFEEAVSEAGTGLLQTA